MKVKYFAFVVINFALAMTSSVVVAQSSSKPPEIELSEEGKRILCERFRLNSRCSGSMATPGTLPNDPTSPNSTAAPESTAPSSENTTAPEVMQPTDSTSPEERSIPGAEPGTNSDIPQDAVPDDVTEPSTSPSTPR